MQISSLKKLPCLSQLDIFITEIYIYGGGGGGVEQYSARLSCFTGLVKLIRSVES